MNNRGPSIGLKMKISNNKELMLKKGNNAIYSDNIYLSQLNNSASLSLLFTLNCVSQSKGILRTFKNFPMIIKQMEDNGNGSITSQRYMNDSIVYLHDLPNIKIIPLTEQKAECILFEVCETPNDSQCLIDNSTQSKPNDSNAKTEMDFLDNIIRYYNQEKTKDCDQTIEDRNIEEKDDELPPPKQEDNYQLSIVINRNEIFKIERNKEIVIEEPKEKEKVLDPEPEHKEEENDNVLEYSEVDNKQKVDKTIKVKYHLRKQIQTPIKSKSKRKRVMDYSMTNDNVNHITITDNDKLTIITGNTNSNSNNNNTTQTYLNKKTKRSSSIPVLKCPICLEPIDNSSYLDTCEHEFCKKCIDHWATVSSQCPCCKKNFKKIIYFNSRSRNRTEKKIKKKKFKPDEEEVEPWYANCDEICFICKKSDNAPLLLVCDQCNFRICHTFCVGLDSIPDEDFICPECDKKSNSANKKRTYHKKNKKMKKYKQNKLLDYIVGKRSVRLRNKSKKYSLRINSKRKVIN